MPLTPSSEGERNAKYGHVVEAVEARLSLNGEELVWECTNCGIRARDLYSRALRNNTCDKDD